MSDPALWLPVAVAGPLLAGVLTLAWRGWAIRIGLALGSISSIVAAGGLWIAVVRGGPVRLSLGGWTPPLGLGLRADGLAVVMLAATAVVGAAVSTYALPYFGRNPDGTRMDWRAGAASGSGIRFFAPLWLFAWASLNGIYLSADLFNLYITLEILGLSAVALVALAVSAEATTAAARYLFVSLVGSLLFLLGCALLYHLYGVLALDGLAAAAPTGPVAALALGAMTVGLAMKTALFPFHGWLPPAHATAPAPASAVLSGLVVKGSFYVMVRLWVDVYGLGPSAGLVVLGLLGGAAIVWGSVMALMQVSLKRLVAFSTVAQLGYLFVMFPLLGGAAAGWSVEAWSGGIVHAVSHAVAKAAMFLAAGAMSYAVGRDTFGALAGIGQRMPLSLLAFGLAGMSLAGIPPSGGFVGKLLLLRAAADQGAWGWVLILGGGGLLTAGYVILVLRHALAPADPRRPDVQGDRPPTRSVPRRLEWLALALALVSVALGFRPTEVLALLGAGGLAGGPHLLLGTP